MSADSYRIAVGADHGGVELKNAVVEALKKAGREFVDYGTHGTDSVDYADFANEVARAVNEEACRSWNFDLHFGRGCVPCRESFP
jgi:ribose 5-phosphate isomerase RpiB